MTNQPTSATEKLTSVRKKLNSVTEKLKTIVEKLKSAVNQLKTVTDKLASVADKLTLLSKQRAFRRKGHKIENFFVKKENFTNGSRQHTLKPRKQRLFSVSNQRKTENPTSAAKKESLRMAFDRRAKLEFHGFQVTSDARFLAIGTWTRR